IGAGLTAAIVGAAIWAIITITTKYQIGWMAVGVGLLVGFAVGYAGGGRASRFLGAFFALFGCIAGNFLSMVAFAADEQRINLFQALTSLDYQKAGAAMFESFWSTDILFYAIAVYEGYRF